MTRWGHRLWWRIWLATIAAIVVVAVVAVVAWRALFDPTQMMSGTATIAAAVAADLPAADAPSAQAQQALERARATTDADLALFDANGRRVARVGRPLPPPRLDDDDSHWVGWHGRVPDGGEGDRPRLPAYAMKIGDGRWLVVRRSVRSLHRPSPPWITFMLIALAVAAGTYPIVRRLTRRLERLQRSVERLGEGDFTARVAVEGRDEVARLAVSFNDAAARIEKLVASHRSLLANASHELRSPLARVRMGVELMQNGARPDLAPEIARDIAELDALIDEILLMSRLDALAPEAQRARFEAIDLTAIVADESQRAGAQVDADAVALHGDARLLRRLVRNLLENARRYGGDAGGGADGSALGDAGGNAGGNVGGNAGGDVGGNAGGNAGGDAGGNAGGNAGGDAGGSAPIEVTLRVRATEAVLAVSDRGPGVAAAERERIFEPFYRAPGASESAGGVGLGLALVRGIAQQHGGHAECLPREGGGSEFRVTLPLQ